MATDFKTFKLKFPELVCSGDSNQDGIQLCIDDAIALIGQPPCPRHEDNLVLSMAAHSVAKSGHNPNGIDEASGAINSVSVGSVSVSYEAGKAASEAGSMGAYYNSTQYGRKFLLYQKYCYGASVMVAP